MVLSLLAPSLPAALPLLGCPFRSVGLFIARCTSFGKAVCRVSTEYTLTPPKSRVNYSLNAFLEVQRLRKLCCHLSVSRPAGTRSGGIHPPTSGHVQCPSPLRRLVAPIWLTHHLTSCAAEPWRSHLCDYPCK